MLINVNRRQDVPHVQEKRGVCGKKADTAALQDELTGALIGLARATDGNTEPDENTYKVMIQGLFMTVTNVNFDNEAISEQIELVRKEKNRLVPDCGSAALPADATRNMI